MNKRVLIFLFLILNFILIASLISATLTTGNLSHSIEKKYGLGQNLVGWINVSLSNQNTNSVFRDSENNQILLINLLKLNPSAGYSCNPKDCEKDYSAINGETTKPLVQAIGTKIYGMFFAEDIQSINSVSLNVSASGIPVSCTNQLEIDFFDDGNIDVFNTVADNEICPGTKTYGCYNSSITGQTEYNMPPSSLYCQKITLPKAPGFRLGAWIKNNSGVGNVSIAIYDGDGYPITGKECNLVTSSTTGEEVGCSINYFVKSPEIHYICLSAQAGGYGIKGYGSSKGAVCGFSGEPIKNPSAAYAIFVESKKFGSFQNMGVTDMLYSEEYLSHLMENEIINSNGDLNCSKGCAIPIKFITNFSSSSFSLNINNIKPEYETDEGFPINNKLYDLIESNATISSGFVKLDLGNSGLKVKNTAGNYTYNLSFEGQKIFSERLTVQKAPIISRITPLKTTYAFPTKFELKVNSSVAISRYEWDFGDGSNITATSLGNVIHIYNEMGDYDLKVVVRDINNITSSKVYRINVTSPSLLINSTLKKMKGDISSLRDQIDDYDLFYRASLNDVIDLNNLSSQVTALENRYKNATGGDYIQIVSDLLEIQIPEEIIITKTASNYIFYPESHNINLDVVGNIEEKDTSDISSSSYADAVFAWNTENINNRLTFKEFSVRYLEGEATEPVLKIFDFSISEKTALNYNSYFIVKNIANLEFKEDYDEKEIDDYAYIELTGGTKNIVFSTTEDVNIDNLPAFIAPPLSRLSIIDSEIPEEEEGNGKWQLFGLIILLLLLIGVVAYIILQTWYKRKYESHLFKNKNDLFNILHYIEAQRKKGVHESEIHYKLKNSGWNSEQIKYATRKHSGLNTGMLEIPVEKLFKKIDEKNTGNR